MSKTWYPVLNYDECINCESCFNKCSHGVYKLKNSRSIVVKPEGCVQGCHGCGNICPVGAIEYFGENTDWTPPGKQGNTEETRACCSNDSNKDSGCTCD
jgi:NAD-dependent dihydropyrimidine dehydrogenase PreA subunit